jgi:hypothetical protein
MSKPPTPQGISRLLKSARFDRSEVAGPGSTRVSGYVVELSHAPADSVRVRYHSLLALGSSARREQMLAAYAKTITEAGWQVKAGPHELIVMAPKES